MYDPPGGRTIPIKGGLVYNPLGGRDMLVG